MPMNVGDAITPAMNHTSHVLFRPFALRKWLALGFVSLLAGMGGGGGGGGGGRYNWPPQTESTPNVEVLVQNVLDWLHAHVALVVVGIIALFAVSLLLSWLGAVSKFVYLNQITRDPAAIREPFHRFASLGTSFFLWELAFSVMILFVVVVLIALPLAGAFLTKAGTAAEVISVIWAAIVGLATLVAIALADIFSRDFVLTAMFVRQVKVIEGWNIVLPILRANAWQAALYILMLIVISLVTAVGVVIAMLAVGLAFLIPGGLLALIGWGIWSASGHHWSPILVSYSAVFGTVLLFAFSYALSCAIQPLAVFRRAYALVVLGQADPRLATIPIPPTDGPRLMPENGV